MDPSQGWGANRGQKRGRSNNHGEDNEEETKEALQPQPNPPPPPPPHPPPHRQQPQAMLPTQHPSSQASSTAHIDLANPLVRQILQLPNADPSRNQLLLQTLRTSFHPQPHSSGSSNPQAQQQLGNILGSPGRPHSMQQGRGVYGADSEILRALLAGGDTQLQNLLPQHRQQHQLPPQGHLQAVLLQLQQQAQQSQQRQQQQQGNLPVLLQLQNQQTQQQQQQQQQQGNFPQAQAAALRQLQAYELQRQLSSGITASTSTTASMPQNHNHQLASASSAAFPGGSASLPHYGEPPAAASLSPRHPNINHPPDTANSTHQDLHGLAAHASTNTAAAVPGAGGVGSRRASAASAAGNNEGTITGRPPRIMHNETDEGRLTPYQCLARKHLEYFEADLAKVEEGAQGRNKAIVLGQVGIRCRFCSHLKRKEKAPAAAFYPSKLDGIYQSAQNIINSHLAKDCKNVPPEVREELLRLGNRKSAPGGGKAYWADEAVQAGVIEDENGLRFAQAQLPSGVASASASAAAAGPATGVDG